MQNISYVAIEGLNRNELMSILNKASVREHLVSHEQFDELLLDDWVAEKVIVNSTKGCRVQGIKVNEVVAGWCGIQFENGSFELAIVLDEKYWGMGVRVFKDVMAWASELGHSKVVLHLLNTRPGYVFLEKMANRVYESTLFGQKYTSYELRVPNI